MNAEVGPIKTTAEQALAAAFHGALQRLQSGPEFVQLRERALASFLESGLPHRRIEDWKYTDLRSLLREASPIAGPPDAAAIALGKNTDPLPDVDVRRLVLMNGSFVNELSDLKEIEPGLTIIPLARALADHHPLVSRLGALKPDLYDAALALNTALMSDGVLIEIAAGAEIKRPLHIRHVYTGTHPGAIYTRALAVFGTSAKATIVESFVGPAGVAYQANSALELHVGDGAHAAFVRLQNEGDQALHLSTLLAKTGKDAQLDTCALTLGAAVCRQSVSLRFSGEGTTARLAGATLLRHRQHADTTLVIDHAVPGCQSRELFKSILDDTSRSVIQGRIIVRPDAQQTDARMMLAALPLAEGAEADHKPELEIFADDVQCAHGATYCRIDEALLFYLRARGIPRQEAEALLIESFFGEALETIAHQGLRTALTTRAAAWLSERERAR